MSLGQITSHGEEGRHGEADVGRSHWTRRLYGRRNDQPWDSIVTRLHQQGPAHRKEASALPVDRLIDSPLKISPEEVDVDLVDAAVHVPKTVSRGDQRIFGDLKDGAMKNRHLGMSPERLRERLCDIT